MLKKIIISLFLCALTINAQTVEKTIEDKYTACEKAFDICAQTCEESNTKYEDCIQNCDKNLYKCNSEVEGLTENPEGEEKTFN